MTSVREITVAELTIPYVTIDRHGIPRTNSAPLDRLMGRVSKDTDGCWRFQGYKNPEGYGIITIRGTQLLTHRVTYMTAKGPIADGLQIDHLCRVRACCNPEHLEAVTPRVNTMRSTSVTAGNAQRTHCKRGHEFDEANTYITRRGARGCRACHRAREAQRMAELKAQPSSRPWPEEVSA